MKARKHTKSRQNSHEPKNKKNARNTILHNVQQAHDEKNVRLHNQNNPCRTGTLHATRQVFKLQAQGKRSRTQGKGHTMNTWQLLYTCKKPNLKSPILIEGLPGIGNVGKIAIDLLIDELEAKPIAQLQSYNMPHSVFVNEDNLVELPAIEVYAKKFKNSKNDLLLLAGDIQPLDEQSCYQFSDTILDLAKDLKCEQVITLGGIALKQPPKNPQVFLTGNNKELIKNYQKGTKANNKLYGIVGHIMGVSGVLVGLAARRNIKAVSLLAETYGHPMYLGIAGARELLKVLNAKLKLNLKMKQLEQEMAELEQDLSQRPELDIARRSFAKLRKKDTSYIG